ncbi:MAG: ferredoxin [Verrucomicrobia bacterium]|nr:ferredoxin [Verrucomicrobiota bacterium]
MQFKKPASAPAKSAVPAAAAPPSRRQFVGGALRGAFLFVLGAATSLIARVSQKERTVWQIDPTKCIACTNCANHCVLTPSAVKCVQQYPICGYCKLCTGYFEPEPNALNTAAENQVCPTGAIERRALEDPYYEYNIDEELCIGCGKCVVGCVVFGNGSFSLQIRHDRCVNCNECAIAMVCPADAFVRVPASQPYLLKTREKQG